MRMNVRVKTTTDTLYPSQSLRIQLPLSTHIFTNVRDYCVATCCLFFGRELLWVASSTMTKRHANYPTSCWRCSYTKLLVFSSFFAATAVVVYIYEHFEASGSPVIVVGGSKYLSFEHKKEQQQIKENAEEHGSIKTTMRLNKTWMNMIWVEWWRSMWFLIIPLTRKPIKRISAVAGSFPLCCSNIVAQHM